MRARRSPTEENGDGPIAEFIRGQLALVAQLERAISATASAPGASPGDDVVNWGDLRRPRVDAEVAEDRHQCLAKRIEQLL